MTRRIPGRQALLGAAILAATLTPAGAAEQGVTRFGLAQAERAKVFTQGYLASLIAAYFLHPIPLGLSGGFAAAAALQSCGDDHRPVRVTVLSASSTIPAPVAGRDRAGPSSSWRRRRHEAL